MRDCLRACVTVFNKPTKQHENNNIVEDIANQCKKSSTGACWCIDFGSLIQLTSKMIILMPR